MNPITKDTTISIALVTTLLGIAYKIGGRDSATDLINTKVQAIEMRMEATDIERRKMREEILQRLTRIEALIREK